MSADSEALSSMNEASDKYRNHHEKNDNALFSRSDLTSSSLLYAGPSFRPPTLTTRAFLESPDLLTSFLSKMKLNLFGLTKTSVHRFTEDK